MANRLDDLVLRKLIPWYDWWTRSATSLQRAIENCIRTRVRVDQRFYLLPQAGIIRLEFFEERGSLLGWNRYYAVE